MVVDIGGLLVNYIGLDDQTKNKTISGRPRDVGGVKALRRLGKENK